MTAINDLKRHWEKLTPIFTHLDLSQNESDAINGIESILRRHADAEREEREEARRLLEQCKGFLQPWKRYEVLCAAIDAFLAAHPAKQQEQGKPFAAQAVAAAQQLADKLRRGEPVVGTDGTVVHQPDYDAQMRERGWEWQNKTTTYLAGWSKVVNAKKFKIWYDTGDNTWNAYMDELEWESFNHPTPTLAADACEEHAKQQEDKA